MTKSKITLLALLGVIQLYSQPLRTFSGHTGPVNSIDISPDGRTLLSGGKDETIRLWDISTAKETKSATVRGSSVKQVRFSSDGSTFVAGLYLRVAEFKTKSLKKKQSGKIHTSFVETAVYSPDNSIVLTSSWRDKTLQTLRSGSLKVQQVFNDTVWIDKAVFSPDGRFVFSGGHDNKIRCRDAVTGDLIRNFTAHDDWVYDVCVSADGKTLYSAGFDKTVRIWEVATGKNIATLRGHNAGVVCLDLSSDGKQLVSGGMDKQIIVWDVAEKKEMKRLVAHEAAVTDVRIAPDGKRVYSCGFDGKIFEWSLE